MQLKGLNNPALRTADATATLTAAEFDWLKKNPVECPTHLREEFEKLLAWEKRSTASKRAVATKRAKYRNWPCNRS